MSIIWNRQNKQELDKTLSPERKQRTVQKNGYSVCLYTEECTTSLIIREIQIKTKMPF